MSRALAVMAFLAACSPATSSLPHRPLTELSSFGQGHNPGKGECLAEQVAIYVDMPDGSTLFLECLRGTRSSP